MSKIGEKPVVIEQGVTAEVKDSTVTIKGTHGEKSLELPHSLSVSIADGAIKIARKREDKRTKALHGLFRSLVANVAQGVLKPWEKRLEIVGTGYNAKMQGEDVILKVGYSHQVTYPKVAGIKLSVEGNNKIVISGIDKQLVGQVAHQIKMIKKPDVYKGKGIKYEGEVLRIKPGKKAKAAGA